MTTADLLLHPVRLRILQTLVGAGELTTAQLRERIPDVPPATMYRHVAALAQAGILEVVRERPIRGTVERSYRVRQEKALIDEDARNAMTKDDHRRAFAVFAGAVIGDFDRYIARDDADPPREGVLYRQGAVHVTEEEFAELVDELEAVVARHTHTEPGDGRTRHIISLVLVPDKPTETPDSTEAPEPAEPQDPGAG